MGQLPFRDLAGLVEPAPDRGFRLVPDTGPRCHGYANGCVCPPCAGRAAAVAAFDQEPDAVKAWFAREAAPRGWHPAMLRHGQVVHRNRSGARLVLPPAPDPGREAQWAAKAHARLAAAAGGHLRSAA